MVESGVMTSAKGLLHPVEYVGFVGIFGVGVLWVESRRMHGSETGFGGFGGHFVEVVSRNVREGLAG